MRFNGKVIFFSLLPCDALNCRANYPLALPLDLRYSDNDCTESSSSMRSAGSVAIRLKVDSIKGGEVYGRDDAMFRHECRSRVG